MGAREVQMMFGFAFQPDDVFYSLSILSKSSLSFLSTNRLDFCNPNPHLKVPYNSNIFIDKFKQL